MANTTPIANRKPMIDWSIAIGQCIANTRTQAPIAARVISMAFEAAYNAWAMFQDSATVKPSIALDRLTALQAATLAKTDDVKFTAVSYAIFTVMSDLFPSQVAGVLTTALDTTAGGIEDLTSRVNAVNYARDLGVLVGQLMIADRANDDSNQKSTLAVGSTEDIYTDWTGYTAPVWDMINDANNTGISNNLQWFRLKFLNASNAETTQTPLTPHWGRVKPNAVPYGDFLRPTVRTTPSTDERTELLTLSANLSTTDKAQVEVWAGNPGTVSPPGQWVSIAAKISAADGNTFDQDVKLFFAVGQAVLDASITAWDTKYVYNTVRPITDLRAAYRGQNISAWGGSGTSGPTTIQGQAWRAYQRTTNPTPPFPEVMSGHSTFSASVATVIAALRKSDYVNFSITQAANGIGFDVNMPPTDVVFNFATLSSAADAAGYSRRLGGIHYEQGDMLGRSTGKRVGEFVYNKCLRLFGGTY